MSLTNHMLTGAFIAKITPLPIAILLAFASHFILDALPHFGFGSIQKRMKHRNWVFGLAAIDFLLTVVLSTWLIKSGHLSWFIVGLIAYSPDLAFVYRFIVKQRFGKLVPDKGSRFLQFHKSIQKYERVWGIIVELIFGLGLFLAVR